MHNMPPPESMESPPKSGIFALSFDETELTLRLPDNHCPLKKVAAMAGPNCSTRGRFLAVDLNAGRDDFANGNEIMSESSLSSTGKSPAAKAPEVAGWPPVRSFRKKALDSHSHAYVKVAVDGAPYLRKLNLEAYGNYPDLLRALEEMCTGFSSCNNSNLHMERRMVPTYEDKDGDWMLVGDVPWKMFKDSCKRIRVMKSSECLSMDDCPI